MYTLSTQATHSTAGTHGWYSQGAGGLVPAQQPGDGGQGGAQHRLRAPAPRHHRRPQEAAQLPVPHRHLHTSQSQLALPSRDLAPANHSSPCRHVTSCRPITAHLHHQRGGGDQGPQGEGGHGPAGAVGAGEQLQVSLVYCMYCVYCV